MGFYYRKSINFGGVRFNISKSGVGTSVGVKGFRIGSGPNGNYIHMGRNGVYYRAALGKKKINSIATQTYQPIEVTQPSERYIFHEIESKDVSLIVDSSSQKIIEEIIAKRKKIPFWPFAIILGIIPTVGVYLAIAVALLLFFLIDKIRKTTILFYDIDEQTEHEIQQFYNGCEQIMACSLKWHISAQAAVYDRKYQAGASALVKRTNVEIAYKTPSYIKTNLKVPMIPVGKQQLFFFPDRILIFEKRKVGGLSYSNLLIDRRDQRFIENGIVPRDGTIVDYTWQYVNKSGGPDRRFKNNRRLPVLLYSDLHFRSDTGLNELIELSRQGVGNEFIAQLTSYKTKAFLTEEAK